LKLDIEEGQQKREGARKQVRSKGVSANHAHDSRIETHCSQKRLKQRPLVHHEESPDQAGKGNENEKSKASRLAKPPSRVYTREARPVASMNWAVFEYNPDCRLVAHNPINDEKL